MVAVVVQTVLCEAMGSEQAEASCPPTDGVSLTPMEANGGTSLSAELTPSPRPGWSLPITHMASVRDRGSCAEPAELQQAADHLC